MSYLKLVTIINYRVNFKPVCQTYWIQTYVDAIKNIHWIGIKKKQIASEVTATKTKKTEYTCGIN